MAKEEGKVQKKITDHLIADGWFVTKLMQTNTNGIPDLLAVKQGKALFIEVKTKVGILSALQKFRINQLVNEFGQQVIVAHGYEDFENKYELYKI